MTTALTLCSQRCIMNRNALPYFLLLLSLLGIAPGQVYAQENAPFGFLGVDAQSEIDPTRKAEYEDFTINMQCYCTGCWCNNVFGDRLSESWNELLGKSEVFKQLWSTIGRCIDPVWNNVPQIRTIPLEARYDDIEFAKATFYFSEFINHPIALRILVNSPDDYLKKVMELFGEPENIEDTWYIWQAPDALLLYDLFTVRRHQREQGELLLVYTTNLENHLLDVQRLKKDTP